MDNITISIVLIFLVGMATFSGAIVVRIFQTVQDQAVCTETHIPKCNLACKCAPYYNLGTNEWADCMQVGKK